ncbi:MAG: carbamate kinase [Deltaproteobacteria bacterium]|nr:carbamate kinase [Deltaproteobacteria bacterium]
MEAKLSVVRNPAAEKVIVSIGGNAIIKRNEKGTAEEQFENVARACEAIGRLVKSGRSVIITHGNGPIVGNIVIRNEAAKDRIPPMPLYICDADSEGGIGFMIQQTLYNQLHKIHNIKDVVTIVTQVLVDRSDEAFSNPSKPLGPYYSEEEAGILRESKGWIIKKDSNRGYRRVVPSPKPRRIIEASVIRRLAESGVIVIAAGGGGVPVIEDEEGVLRGVEAVIDKDLAMALLAKEVKAERFINLTQIDMVYANFGGPGQRPIHEMDVEEAQTYLENGEFAPGSMGPKIEAAIEFLSSGGKEVIITSPELIDLALDAKAGTRIYR